MNKARRRDIFKIIQMLNKILSNIDDPNILTELELIMNEIQMVLDEEESVRDNIPENLQSGYRYEESEEACDNLYDAISELEDIDDEYTREEIEGCISSAIQNLNNCI